MTLIEDSQDGQQLWNRQLECEYPVPTEALPICIQALTVVYRQAERRKWQIFCFMADAYMATPIGYFSKVPHVRTLHKQARLYSHLAFSQSE